MSLRSDRIFATRLATVIVFALTAGLVAPAAASDSKAAGSAGDEAKGPLLILNDTSTFAESIRVHDLRNRHAKNERDMSHTGEYAVPWPMGIAPGKDLYVLPDISGLRDPKYQSTGILREAVVSCPGGICIRNTDGQITFHAMSHDGTVNEKPVAFKAAAHVNGNKTSTVAVGSRQTTNSGDMLAVKHQPTNIWSRFTGSLVGEPETVTEGVVGLSHGHGVSYHQGELLFEQVKGGEGYHRVSFTHTAGQGSRPTIMSLVRPRPAVIQQRR